MLLKNLLLESPVPGEAGLGTPEVPGLLSLLIPLRFSYPVVPPLFDEPIGFELFGLGF